MRSPLKVLINMELELVEPRFVFIIWLQRMKMVHQRKIESTRELYGLSPSDESNEEDLKKRALATATGPALAQKKHTQMG